ncbi:MAG: hypothetical protein ACLTSX_04925 [Collinsella sp.]
MRGGAGITFLYRVAVEEELARGKLADITPDDFAIEHDFCLIWQRGKPVCAALSLPLRRMAGPDVAPRFEGGWRRVDAGVG